MYTYPLIVSAHRWILGIASVRCVSIFEDHFACRSMHLCCTHFTSTGWSKAQQELQLISLCWPCSQHWVNTQNNSERLVHIMACTVLVHLYNTCSCNLLWWSILLYHGTIGRMHTGYVVLYRGINPIPLYQGLSIYSDTVVPIPSCCTRTGHTHGKVSVVLWYFPMQTVHPIRNYHKWYM